MEKINDKAIEDIFMELDAIFCVEMESGKKVDHDVILRKQAKAALEAATPHILAGQWQDIESAPKGGTRVLVYTYAHNTIDMAWHDGERWNTETLLISPTHWMPLPNPPQTPSAESE